MNPAAVQSFDQCRLQRGGTEPPIIAHSDPASACPRDQRAEAPANRIGVLFGECFTDNAANFILSQGGRVERSDEHTSELQSLMRRSYSVLCLKHKNPKYYCSLRLSFSA